MRGGGFGGRRWRVLGWVCGQAGVGRSGPTRRPYVGVGQVFVCARTGPRGLGFFLAPLSHFPPATAKRNVRPSSLLLVSFDVDVLHHVLAPPPPLNHSTAWMAGARGRGDQLRPAGRLYPCRVRRCRAPPGRRPLALPPREPGASLFSSVCGRASLPRAPRAPRALLGYSTESAYQHQFVCSLVEVQGARSFLGLVKNKSPLPSPGGCVLCCVRCGMARIWRA